MRRSFGFDLDGLLLFVDYSWHRGTLRTLETPAEDDAVIIHRVRTRYGADVELSDAELERIEAEALDRGRELYWAGAA